MIPLDTISYIPKMPLLNGGSEFIKQLRPGGVQKPVLFSRTTLALFAFVSVSVIGIGYLIFIQQQELKQFMNVLNKELTQINTLILECPVMGKKKNVISSSKKKCNNAQKCSVPGKKDLLDTRDADFCLRQIGINSGCPEEDDVDNDDNGDDRDEDDDGEDAAIFVYVEDEDEDDDKKNNSSPQSRSQQSQQQQSEKSIKQQSEEEQKNEQQSSSRKSKSKSKPKPKAKPKAKAKPVKSATKSKKASPTGQEKKKTATTPKSKEETREDASRKSAKKSKKTSPTGKSGAVTGRDDT